MMIIKLNSLSLSYSNNQFSTAQFFKGPLKINIYVVFNCYLAAPRPAHAMLITDLITFDPKVTGSLIICWVPKTNQEPSVFFNWDSIYARLNSHYKAWSYRKKKHKKIKAYRKSL